MGHIRRTGPRAGGGGSGWLLASLALAAASVLFRAGNSTARVPPTANLLGLATPVLAVVWLAIAGVNIPRPGLFALGAALILASTAAAVRRPGPIPAAGPSER